VAEGRGRQPDLTGDPRCLRRQEKPFFTFLHYWDPPHPVSAALPFARMFYSGDEKDPVTTPPTGCGTTRLPVLFRRVEPGVTDAKFRLLPV